MPPKTPRVLVIVITYNGNHWIHECLSSLQQSAVPLDVLVVDNQSTDNTVGIVKEQFPKVQLIESPKNLGFGQGNNVGMKMALDKDYDYAFLLNQDAWIESDTVKTLIEVHQRHPQYGILTPIHLNREETKLDRNFAGYLYQSHNIALMSELLIPTMARQDVYTVGFVNAAAWFISRACLQKVGGFDPLFPHYGEDQDYIQRVTYHGFEIGFTPHTKIIHDREGYAKQSEKRRTLPIQYNGSLILLKNVHRPFKTNLYIAIRNEIYHAIVALSALDICQFVVKLKLLRKILSNASVIRRSRKFCIVHRGAYLT